jgi:hypothetical protein
VAGSLTLGEVRGHDLIRTLSRDGRPTELGDAFAHHGRIFKTLRLLHCISDDGYRRMIGKHLNITEARHRPARRIFFDRRGELRQDHLDGTEDQIGALGLALNAMVQWCSGAVVQPLPGPGGRATRHRRLPRHRRPARRLSPLQFDHINFPGLYAFFRPQEAGRSRMATAFPGGPGLTAHRAVRRFTR